MQKTIRGNKKVKPSFRQPVESEFLGLKKKVGHLVERECAKKQRTVRFKLFLFPFLYVCTYASLLVWGENPYIFFTCYVFLGVFLLLNFLNLIHDAVHGVTFDSHKLNRNFLYFFDLLGANSYIWKIRHLRLHHAFPNVMGWDSDLEQSPLVRVFPQSPLEKIQRFQHLYLPFLYPLYLFNWLLVRDFKDFFIKTRAVHRVAHISRKEYFKLFLFKFIFLSYMIVIPKLVLNISWSTVLMGFVCFMLTASILSLVVLLSPHASITSKFPRENDQGELPDTWFMHQLVTTNDVSTDNFFIRFFMASFNYHVAHHLFPYIHHSYYPSISQLIEEFSVEHGIPYRKQSLSRSLLNHYTLLKKNARVEDLFEETM